MTAEQKSFWYRPRTRRNILREAGRVGLVATGIALAPELGCSPSNAYPEDITKHYPELKSVKLPIQTSDKIYTSDQIPTIVYNLSSYRYNPVSAKAIFTYFEELGALYKAQDDRALINHPYDGRDHIFAPMPITELYPKIKKRVIVITPDDAPKPSWSFNRRAATRINTHDDITTVIRTGNTRNDEIFTTPQETATVAFATEACAQLLATLVYDVQRGTIPLSDRDRIRAQEIVGNSFGRAVAAGILSITYERYAQFMTGKIGNLPERDLVRFPYIVISEERYSRIPKVGSVLE